MTLPEAIKFYQRTATDLSVAIPEELKRAEYRELFRYYAYELPFILAWGETQAGNDYFMKKNRGLPCDDILRYEAERNARLLYNEVHRNTPIEEFPPLRRNRRSSRHPTADARRTPSTPSTRASRPSLPLRQGKCTTRDLQKRL